MATETNTTALKYGLLLFGILKESPEDKYETTKPTEKMVEIVFRKSGERLIKNDPKLRGRILLTFYRLFGRGTNFYIFVAGQTGKGELYRVYEMHQDIAYIITKRTP